MVEDHHRYDALEALTAFLEGRMDAVGLYQWALKKATAADYATVIGQDPLMKELIAMILEIHTRCESDDQALTDRIESVWYKAVSHYHACLSGTRVFVPQDDVIRHLIPEEQTTQEKPKTRTFVSHWFSFLRAYVVLFALGVIAVYGLALWRPGWLFPEGMISRAEVLNEAWPLWIYGVVLMIPPKIWGKGLMFYPALVVLAAGMVYFWYITVRLIAPVQWHPGFLLLVGLTAAVPSTLALLMLIEARLRFKEEGVA